MRQLFKSVACAAVMGLIVPMTAGAQPDKVSLKPNWTPGYEATVIMETTRTSTRILQLGQPDAAPQENSTVGQQTIEFLMKVARSDEKGATVTLRVDRIEMTAKTVRGEFAWKSTDPRAAGDNTNLVLTTMRPALGATITIDLDAEGNVTKTDNGGVQLPTGEIVDFIRLVVGTQEVRNRWSPVLSPKKGDFNVQIGQKWSGEEKWDSPPLGQFTARTEYSLASATEKEAIVNMTGSFELGPVNGQTPMFKVKESSMKGSIAWDRGLGLFKTAEVEQRIHLEGNAQGMPIGFRTETKVKVRREEKSQPKP